MSWSVRGGNLTDVFRREHGSNLGIQKWNHPINLNGNQTDPVHTTAGDHWDHWDQSRITFSFLTFQGAMLPESHGCEQHHRHLDRSLGWDFVTEEFWETWSVYLVWCLKKSPPQSNNPNSRYMIWTSVTTLLRPLDYSHIHPRPQSSLRSRWCAAYPCFAARALRCISHSGTCFLENTGEMNHKKVDCWGAYVGGV